jgi:pyruvate,orthophosphate dikinase
MLKRTGLAGIRWAVEMATGKDVETGEKLPKLLTNKKALATITGDDLEQLLFPIFDIEEEAKQEPLLTALPAGPGAAVGKIVFDAKDAEAMIKENPDERLILVRQDTSPEDVGGMWAAKGILTSTGGMTSHAAVVARGWGKCCICGASDLKINAAKKEITVNGKTLKAGDWISLNGSTGKVYSGELPTMDSPVVSAVSGNAAAKKHAVYKMYKHLSDWADQYRTINVRANADSPADAVMARAFGAEGIGLCRTEHMFFEGDRIWDIRSFILADSKASREKALKKLLPHQRKDFEGLFRAMKGLPVTVRLLDPPLHEFLPHTLADQEVMAKHLDVDLDLVKSRVSELHESNPMLGHRGCRLSITFPELCVMQTRAIIEAACNVLKRSKIKAEPEIMIPLVGTKTEIDLLEKLVRKTADEVLEKRGAKIPYKIGTMIEIPRAALIADEIAETAEFFSFGTNDLTQLTYGYSRDDIGAFLPDYLEQKILDVDPFQSLDQNGVGQLVQMAVQKGRSTRPGLKCGICGEHGGDPASVKFCVKSGLDYVSCSPYRVPIARVAAAQAAI